MKSIILLALLFTISSCEENIASYNTLTDDERSNIRDRAKQKCLSDSLADFTALKKISNQEMAKFVRGDFWKITVPGNTTADFMYVWKVSGTTVYFLHQEKQGADTYHQFIKVTPTFNAEMFDDIRIKKCNTKIPVISQSSATFSVKYDDILSTEGSTKYKSDTTYTGKETYPAYFALFTRKIFKEKLKTDGTVDSSETLNYSIKYEGNDAVLLDSFASYSNKKYCVHEYTNTVPKTFTFPFKVSCVDTLATNPNIFGDPTMDFTSADL